MKNSYVDPLVHIQIYDGKHTLHSESGVPAPDTVYLTPPVEGNVFNPKWDTEIRVDIHGPVQLALLALSVCDTEYHIGGTYSAGCTLGSAVLPIAAINQGREDT